MESENLFGKSYAKTTKKAMGPTLKRGAIPTTSKEQFQTSYQRGLNQKNYRQYCKNGTQV